MKKALAIVLLVLLADQILKIYIKTHFTIGEGYPIFGSWSYLLFIENEGMAFGWKFMGKHGKLFLSIFRIIAATGIGWYLLSIIRRNVPTGMIVAFSLIFAGAVGNIIDSAFYGLLFTESTMLTRAAFDPANGYATFLHGKVVDMFYFPMVEGYWPEWKILPAGLRGDHFLFFRPVFNLADSSITVGVLILLLFQKRYFHHPEAVAGAEPDNKTAAPEIEEHSLSNDDESVTQSDIA